MNEEVEPFKWMYFSPFYNSQMFGSLPYKAVMQVHTHFETLREDTENIKGTWSHSFNNNISMQRQGWNTVPHKNYVECAFNFFSQNVLHNNYVQLLFLHCCSIPTLLPILQLLVAYTWYSTNSKVIKQMLKHIWNRNCYHIKIKIELPHLDGSKWSSGASEVQCIS